MPARAGIIDRLHCPVVTQGFRIKRTARVSRSEWLLGFDRAAENQLLGYQVPQPARKSSRVLQQIIALLASYGSSWRILLTRVSSPVLPFGYSGEESARYKWAEVLRPSRWSEAAFTSERRHSAGRKTKKCRYCQRRTGHAQGRRARSFIVLGFLPRTCRLVGLFWRHLCGCSNMFRNVLRGRYALA